MYIFLIPTTFDSNYVRAIISYFLAKLKNENACSRRSISSFQLSIPMQALSSFLLLEKKKPRRRKKFDTLRFIVCMSICLFCAFAYLKFHTRLTNYYAKLSSSYY